LADIGGSIPFPDVSSCENGYCGSGRTPGSKHPARKRPSIIDTRWGDQGQRHVCNAETRFFGERILSNRHAFALSGDVTPHSLKPSMDAHGITTTGAASFNGKQCPRPPFITSLRVNGTILGRMVTSSGGRTCVCRTRWRWCWHSPCDALHTCLPPVCAVRYRTPDSGYVQLE
jgi:hypothetical protein